MNKSIIAAAVAAVMCMSCNQLKNNPFLQESQLPYGAIEFDKIKSSDFLPAFEEGFRQYKKDIDRIAACKESPTFPYGNSLKKASVIESPC